MKIKLNASQRLSAASNEELNTKILELEEQIGDLAKQFIQAEKSKNGALANKLEKQRYALETKLEKLQRQIKH